MANFGNTLKFVARKVGTFGEVFVNTFDPVARKAALEAPKKLFAAAKQHVDDIDTFLKSPTRLSAELSKDGADAKTILEAAQKAAQAARKQADDAVKAAKEAAEALAKNPKDEALKVAAESAKQNADGLAKTAQQAEWGAMSDDALQALKSKAEAAVKDAGHGIKVDHKVEGSFWSKPFTKTASYITWGIRKPFAMTAELTGHAIEGFTKAYAWNPYVTTGAVAAAGGAYGLHQWGESQRRDALATQGMVEQAKMQQSPYQVTPQEAALLAERMSEGGSRGSMADKIMAERAALQATPVNNV